LPPTFAPAPVPHVEPWRAGFVRQGIGWVSPFLPPRTGQTTFTASASALHDVPAKERGSLDAFRAALGDRKDILFW